MTGFWPYTVGVLALYRRGFEPDGVFNMGRVNKASGLLFQLNRVPELCYLVVDGANLCFRIALDIDKLKGTVFPQHLHRALEG